MIVPSCISIDCIESSISSELPTAPTPISAAVIVSFCISSDSIELFSISDVPTASAAIFSEVIVLSGILAAPILVRYPLLATYISTSSSLNWVYSLKSIVLSPTDRVIIFPFLIRSNALILFCNAVSALSLAAWIAISADS